MAAARALAGRGAAVILHGRDSLRLRAECEKLPDPSRHRYVAADLAKTEEVLYLADEVSRRQGRLDVLIHCAGSAEVQVFTSIMQLEPGFQMSKRPRFQLAPSFQIIVPSVW